MPLLLSPRALAKGCRPLHSCFWPVLEGPGFFLLPLFKKGNRSLRYSEEAQML